MADSSARLASSASTWINIPRLRSKYGTFTGSMSARRSAASTQRTSLVIKVPNWRPAVFPNGTTIVDGGVMVVRLAGADAPADAGALGARTAVELVAGVTDAEAPPGVAAPESSLATSRMPANTRVWTVRASAIPAKVAIALLVALAWRSMTVSEDVLNATPVRPGTVD